MLYQSVTVLVVIQPCVGFCGCHSQKRRDENRAANARRPFSSHGHSDRNSYLYCHPKSQ
ncbi:Uncharacterised protein [Vibrio cholerae]|nr:Uncharacterised protein [Vibrio cholerae]